MSILDPNSEVRSIFEFHTKNLLDAIQLCLRNELIIPALILVYAGIDAMSWLNMPENQTEVKPEDFVGWAEKYLLPELPYPILWFNGWDLYGARCALLHSHSAESRKSARGEAQEIHYEYGAGNVYVNLALNAPKPPVVLNVQHLTDAFAKAIDSFRRKLPQESQLAERVYKRARRWFYKGRWA